MFRLKQKEIPPYTINKEYFAKLDKDQIEFILSHAEKHLKETTAIGTIIVGRTSTVVTIVTGIVVAVSGYIIQAVPKWSWSTPEIVAVITLVYLLILALFLATNMRGYTYAEVGNEPGQFLIDRFMNMQDDQRLKFIKLAEIQSYQRRINLNKQTNDNRWSLLRLCMILLILTPVIISLAALAVYAFTCLPHCLCRLL